MNIIKTESSHPLQYQLYSRPYYHCGCCDSSSKDDNPQNKQWPLHSGKNNGFPTKNKNDVITLVDVESDLWNINRRLSSWFLLVNTRVLVDAILLEEIILIVLLIEILVEEKQVELLEM